MHPIAALMIPLTLSSQSPAGGSQQQHDEPNELQLGTTHFPVSCDARVQKTIERGVALLHSFAFETAEMTFTQVAQDDPQCAIAHWGIARSLWRWDAPEAPIRKRGWAEVVRAKALHPPTKREKEYIASVAALYRSPDKKDDSRWNRYMDRLARLHRDFPDDHEATAFYAFALVGADKDDDPTHAKLRQAAALLEPLFDSEPNHPGVAHYLIHAYDKPDLAQLGLPAALRYAQIAPAAPHALHMPSHIFAQLGLWHEDIQSNLASIAASRNAAVSHMGEEGHQYHAMEFLMYACLQSGRDEQAKKLIEEVRVLPKMKSMYGGDEDPQVLALALYSASYVLELHLWDKAETLPLTQGAQLGDDSITYLARAIGAARSGHAEEARRNVAEIESLYRQVVAKKIPWADWVDDKRKEAEAWADYAEDKNDQAIQLLSALVDKQKEGMFAAQGDLPAREMIGDMLLDKNKPEQALAEYEAQLRLNPNRFDSLYGAARAAEMMKQSGKAASYYGQLLKICANGNSNRPELRHARDFMFGLAVK
jgi:tetratricopeptide (TPR) repeat protein